MVVVFVIHKTSQLSMQSIKLFRVLSIIDTLNSTVILLHLKVMLYPQASCMYYYVLNFLLFFGIYNTMCIVAVVYCCCGVIFTYLLSAELQQRIHCNTFQACY